jgi:predicted Zn-dependent protease
MEDISLNTYGKILLFFISIIVAVLFIDTVFVTSSNGQAAVFLPDEPLSIYVEYEYPLIRNTFPEVDEAIVFVNQWVKTSFTSSTTADICIYVKNVEFLSSSHDNDYRLGTTYNFDRPATLFGNCNSRRHVVIAGDQSMVTQVIVHELLHAFGLGHSTNPRDVMYPNISDDQYVTEEDINELNRLYPDNEHPIIHYYRQHFN